MKVVPAVVGGVGAAVALAVAYRRQRLNEVEAYREDAKVLLDRFGKAGGRPDPAGLRLPPPQAAGQEG
ncbi:hypothetical protein ACQPYE_22270 [Actinosynnema sp. CA-299493]